MLGPEAISHIDALAQRTIDESEAPGLALGISLPGGERLLRTYGLANQEAAVPVGDTTLFEIGSIAKQMLAVVCLQLVDEGRLDLHAPVTEYLPWFAVRAAHPPITAHHLLTHTAGLPSGTTHRLDGPYEAWELRNVRTAAPESVWNYSNIGYDILGFIAEAILDQPFDQLLHQRVLAPLHLRDSFASVTSALRPRLATGYKRQFDDRPWQPGMAVYPATWLETSTGAGSVAMTASDLLAWAEMLLRTWNGHDSPVLTTARLRQMIDPATLPAVAVAEEYGHGLAWTTGDAPDRPISIGHGGDMVGYESSMQIDLVSGACVVVLANGEAPCGRLGREIRSVLAAALDGAPIPALSSETLAVFAGSGDWVGHWRSAQRTIAIVQDRAGALELVDGAIRVPLTRPSRFGTHRLVAAGSAWDRFALEAVRDEASGDIDQPPIGRIHHGGETFYPADRPMPEPVTYPAEWEGFAGHYRSYSPWIPSLWVVIREGRLTLIDTFGDARELVPEGTGFRVGAQPPNLDWLTFEAIAGGRALAIRFETGAIYSRFFIP